MQKASTLSFPDLKFLVERNSISIMYENIPPGNRFNKKIKLINKEVSAIFYTETY
jgi:hypothetical protein